MNHGLPTCSKTRPNWYKVNLPRNLTMWAIECLKEHVDIKKYQSFKKVSVSCKNNGKTVFVRLLYESKLYNNGTMYGSEQNLTGLPVSYLIEVNKGILKGNNMDYHIRNDVKYNEVYPIYNKTVQLTKDSKLVSEKHKLYSFVHKFEIPRVGSRDNTAKEK